MKNELLTERQKLHRLADLEQELLADRVIFMQVIKTGVHPVTQEMIEAKIKLIDMALNPETSTKEAVMSAPATC